MDASRSRRASGAPKASQSASVRSQPGQGAITPARIFYGLRTYSQNLLHALRPTPGPYCKPLTPGNSTFNCLCCDFSFTTLSCRESTPSNHKMALLSANNDAVPGTEFSFLSINCRSLRKHKEDIHDLLLNTQPDAIFLTETWLNGSSGPDIAIALPPNYTILRKDCMDKIGGGYSNNFQKRLHLQMRGFILKGCEASLFKLSLTPNFTLSGILIYRPPGPAGPWATGLPDLIVPLLLEATNLTILGDFNIHFNEVTCTISSTLITDLAAMNVSLCNSGPTHKAGYQLDPIFSNLANISCQTALPILWSDHFVVGFKVKQEMWRANPSTFSIKTGFRNWKNLDVDCLHLHFKNTMPVITTANIDDANN